MVIIYLFYIGTSNDDISDDERGSPDFFFAELDPLINITDGSDGN
jgi:hypothetical protein